MKGVIKLDGCVNCGACMLACSVHHTGAFSYEHSSIIIHQVEDGYTISYRTPNTCDTCEGEGTGNYRCVKYCHRAQNALQEFILSQGEGGD